LIARENGLSVDVAQFGEEMQQQKERSRNAAIQETGDWIELFKTEKVEFTGYRELEILTRIARYRSVSRNNKDFFQVVLEKTPFYAESGGQVGDSGYLESEGKRTEVLNTVRENNLIIHILARLPDSPEALFKASVDVKRRRSTACNHTATHLLDHALREILGKHVEQKGSLVHPDYLRFDFSHFGKMSLEELDAVQKRVNQMIRQNLEKEEMDSISMDEARDMGAIAIFGEKYGDKVRVIRFGDSVELCGGTHVTTTGLIGQFIILSEGAISAGVRRIEAITGDRADEFIAAELRELAEARSLFSHPKNIGSAIRDLKEENNRLKKQVETFEAMAVVAQKDKLLKGIRKVGKVNLIAGQPEIDTLQGVKDLAFRLKAEVPSLYLVLGGLVDGKPYLTILISDEVVSSKKLDASKIIREAAREIRGGGGGQPFYATAGGKYPAGIAAAIEKAISLLSDY
jgi:alanyl-tRNA synthetase